MRVQTVRAFGVRGKWLLLCLDLWEFGLLRCTHTRLAPAESSLQIVDERVRESARRSTCRLAHARRMRQFPELSVQASVRLPPEFAVADNEGDLPQVVKVPGSHSVIQGGVAPGYRTCQTVPPRSSDFSANYPIPAIFRNSGWSPRFDSSLTLIKPLYIPCRLKYNMGWSHWSFEVPHLARASSRPRCRRRSGSATHGEGGCPTVSPLVILLVPRRASDGDAAARFGPLSPRRLGASCRARACGGAPC